MNAFLPIEDYPAARDKVDGIFYSERELPQQVFRHSYRFYLFHEFESAMWDFAECLQHCRPIQAQETILLYTLRPDALEHYYKIFQTLGAFLFKGTISKSEFYRKRAKNPGKETIDEGNAITFTSDIELFIPESRSWAMWGDHDWDITVLGLDDAELVFHLVEENGYWLDAETASATIACQAFRNQIVPESFSRPLIANYGSLADLEAKLGRKVVYPNLDDL